MLRLLQYLFFSFFFFLFTACQESKRQADNGAFASDEKASKSSADYDFEDIQQSGELIVATLSGPDTYYEYQGRALGLQYALADHFARGEGLRVRMEIAPDTAALVRLLKGGEADIIALPLPLAMIKKNGLAATGACDAKQKTSWAVRADAPQLAEALKTWYAAGIELAVEKEERQRVAQRHTYRRRQVRAPFISQQKGIISIYDNEFKRAAAEIGWDWRLLAAQCYQESGFDPNAISWAGAQGLMQIMPATAAHLGLSEQNVFEPRANIAAAARYLRELSSQLSDVRSPAERLCFVLAAYNGGLGHIRDAQALARKHGKNPHAWTDVSHFVLALSQPQYYRDPAVRHGYMIGAETFGYVESIMKRWQKYGGNPALVMRQAPTTAVAPATADNNTRQQTHKRNRYSKEHKILSPEELKNE